MNDEHGACEEGALFNERKRKLQLQWRKLYHAKAKLKASTSTSALLSGFAMIAMVEVQLEKGIPEVMLIAFATCTTLLVAVHLLALMISTCLLPNIEAVSNSQSITAVYESPHESMKWCIEMAWFFSTTLGIILFLIEIGLLCWVKFWMYNKKAAIASTVIVTPAFILFIVFGIIFYRRLVSHQYERSHQGIEELESMAGRLHV